jgi:hypothetical protein
VCEQCSATGQHTRLGNNIQKNYSLAGPPRLFCFLGNATPGAFEKPIQERWLHWPTIVSERPGIAVETLVRQGTRKIMFWGNLWDSLSTKTKDHSSKQASKHQQ